jgi:hypothetical protein
MRNYKGKAIIKMALQANNDIDYSEPNESDYVPLRKSMPICDSSWCIIKAKTRGEKITAEGVIKNIVGKPDWCPHCKSAIFWKKF